MMPVNAPYDVTHLGLAEAKHAPKFALYDVARGIQRPHAFGIFGRDLRVSLPLARFDAIVRPRPTADYLPNLTRRHAELTGHVNLTGRAILPTCADLLDLFARQFRVSVLLTARRVARKAGVCWRTVAALSGPVRVVLGGSANKQVRRVTAARVVTVMAHAQAFWDRSISLFPRNSVRRDTPVNLCPPTAVSAGVGCSRPRPTFIGLALRHVGMKTGDLFGCKWSVFHAASISQVGV